MSMRFLLNTDKQSHKLSQIDSSFDQGAINAKFRGSKRHRLGEEGVGQAISESRSETPKSNRRFAGGGGLRRTRTGIKEIDQAIQLPSFTNKNDRVSFEEHAIINNTVNISMT